MTSKLENFSVNYFLTRALFLGIGFSVIIGLTKQDSILVFSIGTIIGLFLIFFINKINAYKGEKTLNEILKEMKVFGILLRIIFIIYGFCLLCEGISFIGLFASSFFLIRTPIWLITLPLLLLILRITKNGIKTTFRVATSLFPISAFLTIISLICLCGYGKIDNISPIFVSDSLSFIKATFYYVSLSVTPSILMLVTNSNNTYSYLFGSLTLILKMALIIAIVGPLLASIYRFPEYIILKEIKILDFIEKIENIVATSWIFDVFIYLAMSSLFIKEVMPKSKIIYPLIILASYITSCALIGKYYTNEIKIYYLFPIFSAIIFLIVIPILFIHLKRKKGNR